MTAADGAAAVSPESAVDIRQGISAAGATAVPTGAGQRLHVSARRPHRAGGPPLSLGAAREPRGRGPRSALLARVTHSGTAQVCVCLAPPSQPPGARPVAASAKVQARSTSKLSSLTQSVAEWPSHLTSAPVSRTPSHSAALRAATPTQTCIFRCGMQRVRSQVDDRTCRVAREA